MATRKKSASNGKTAVNFRRYSSEVVDGLKQAPSRAMLRAVGYKDADFKKPAIGIASTWSNLTPCNMHIDKLAKAAAAAVDSAGGEAETSTTLQMADRHRIDALRHHACSLALVLLWTDAACDGRQRVVLPNLRRGAEVVAQGSPLPPHG